MELNTFIQTLETYLEDVTPGTIKADTRFRELEEWDSMSGLIVIAMTDKEYNKVLSGDEIKSANTVEELFNLVASK